MAELTERLGALSPRQRTLFELRQKDKGTQSATRIQRRPADVVCPLSFAQQRLWFLEQWAQGSAAYHIPLVLYLEGVLDVGRLEESLNAVTARHEALRTSIGAESGEPSQTVAPAVAVALNPETVGSEEHARRIADEEAQCPFDLSRAPLFRARLLRLTERTHWLLLTMHHLISDGWSVSVFVRDLAAAYEGRQLEPLMLQYGDFAYWQRQWLQGPVLGEQLGYWRRQLAELTPLELATDHMRPPVASQVGSAIGLRIDAALLKRLKLLAQQEAGTTFMVLLAAVVALLGRYTGQDDIAVGTPIANRNRVDLERLIGVFVNTLVLRTRVSPRATFRDLVKEVRQVTLEAYAHQDLPFERLVEDLQPQRDLSRNPLVQVAVQLQNMPEATAQMGGIEIRPGANTTVYTRFDLEVHFADGTDGIDGRLQYRTDLWSGQTMQRFADHFHRLLAAALRDPDEVVAELPLLGDQEREQMLLEWNTTAALLPAAQSVQELFEEQVQQHPDRPAVISGNECWSYEQLNAKANQLAHYLRDRGVGRDIPVVVCLERSAELILAVIAVLKAGGAYVPLDPTYPLRRLRWLLADSGGGVVLTRSEWRETVGDSAVCLDTDWSQIASARTENPTDRVSGHDLAYVVYTSGSTGEPKGVAVHHRGLMNLVAWHQREYEVGPDDRATQLASPAFDAMGWEIWPYLTAGASVHVVPEEIRIEPRRLMAWMAEHGITLSFLPTPLAEAALEEGVPDGLSLRALLTGGDRLHRSWSGLPFRLTNQYGPTESSVVATWCEVDDTSGPPPIGKPISNTRVYVLDCNGEPVPVGVGGELHIGGDGLARGYWQRPDLTAERFIRNPIDPVGILYRTGDRVRWRSDGQLEFLGRIDQQVKIRGFRVELGEIEAILGQHPGVRQAVTIVREDNPAQLRLVAYVVGEGDDAVLRDYLRDRLPDYMVPSAFVFLPALPLTSNGKLDRSALPAPTLSSPIEYVGARTPVEETVMQIWTELLGVDRISVDDNFFDLGGHSLMATRVISRVRQSLGVELPVRVLFESPTIAKLAQRINIARRKESVAAPDLAPAADGERPLSFSQEGLWFVHELLPSSAAYNMPLVLRLDGPLDAERLRCCLNQVVGRHESLRTRFETVDRRPVQVVVPLLEVDLPVDVVGSVDEARRMAEDEVMRCFDLTRVPLVRARLVRLSGEEHWLVLTMHHAISDGWSLGVFVREMATLYEGGRLAPLAIQYGDFAVWQRQWLQGAVLEEQLAYWRRQLAEVPVLQLPTDRARPALMTYRGAGERIDVPAHVLAKLKALSRQEGATLYMVLLAVFAALLGRYTRQEDVVVGSPIANRNRTEMEPLIGLFVNTLVLRTDLSGAPSFRDLLRRVRDVTLDAYAHQDVPFEKLVQELQPERDMSRNPLVQVQFQLQNLPARISRMGDVAMSPAFGGSGATRCDLEVHLSEAESGLEGCLQYSIDLWDPATIQRLGQHYVRLLEAAGTEPGDCINTLPLLSVAERQQVLVEWNQTTSDYPRHSSLQQLFEQVVERAPDAIAVVFDGVQLSYGELNARANQLAHYLRDQGVGPDVPVGVCVERSLEMVVGLLGIIKAGGAYVPLDPAYPADRLAFMVEDTDVRVLVTQGHVSAPAARSVVCLDRDWAAIARHSPENPPPMAGPTDLAYLIYTSGSTGRPKAVAVPQRAIVRLVKSTDYAEFGPDEVMLQFAPLAFDASTFEIWGALLNGGRLVVLPPQLPSLEELRRAVREHGVTTLWLTAGLFHQMIDEPGEALQGLRQLLAGGDVLSPAHVRQALQKWPGCRLINGYGPTENTTFTCCHRMTSVDDVGTSVPIGRPIANTRVYVLDQAGHPVPVGVAGELYIGGDGLARGYWRRPELTAERFVASALDSDGRLYRTGDLVRWNADGDLEFLGRIDQQVKIRGFRIEPGEIEAVLSEHAAVQHAVVVAREQVSGGKRLVAYVVSPTDATAAGLHEYVRQRLPEVHGAGIHVP